MLNQEASWQTVLDEYLHMLYGDNEDLISLEKARITGQIK